MNRSKEHQALLDRVLLKIGGLPYVRVWPNNTGSAVTDAGNYVRYGLPGSADITGILTDARGNGLRLEIEIKTGSGVLSDKQKKFRDMICKMGGLYLECRNENDALNFVRVRHEKTDC